MKRSLIDFATNRREQKHANCFKMEMENLIQNWHRHIQLPLKLAVSENYDSSDCLPTKVCTWKGINYELCGTYISILQTRVTLHYIFLYYSIL